MDIKYLNSVFFDNGAVSDEYAIDGMFYRVYYSEKSNVFCVSRFVDCYQLSATQGFGREKLWNIVFFDDGSGKSVNRYSLPEV